MMLCVFNACVCPHMCIWKGFMFRIMEYRISDLHVLLYNQHDLMLFS